MDNFDKRNYTFFDRYNTLSQFTIGKAVKV